MKRLKIEIETYDSESGISTGKESAKTIYCNKTGDPVSVNEIEVEQIRWNRVKGRVYVVYSIGGRNNGGEFVEDKTKMQLPYLFLRDKHTQALWKKYKLDDGPPTADIVKQMLLEEKPAINTVARMNWIDRKDLPTKRFTAELVEE